MLDPKLDFTYEMRRPDVRHRLVRLWKCSNHDYKYRLIEYRYWYMKNHSKAFRKEFIKIIET
jgi:hypothetical protein